MAQWNGFPGTLSSVCEIWDRCGANGEFIALCVTLSDYFPQRFQNSHLLARHLLLELRQGSSRLRYRSSLSQTRQSMEPVPRSLSTYEFVINCEFLECTQVTHSF
jgi:hypothetical protein